MALLRAACARTGKPLTPQRSAVLEELCGRSDHPTADAIHVAVARRLPGVSRATVYRTLDTLVGFDLAQRVNHDGVAVRFDARTDRHHHFFCDHCDSITDVDHDPEWGSPRLPTASHQARDFTVLFRGTCRECHEAERVRDSLHA